MKQVNLLRQFIQLPLIAKLKHENQSQNHETIFATNLKCIKKLGILEIN